jgi:hypothetical protein
MSRVDCDQVFEVLTRGPFPTGEAIDGPVERHLATCHECRALAEALRPAMELLHEAIDGDESRDLPGYYGAPSTSGGLAQLVAAAIDAEPTSPRASKPRVEPALRWRTWLLTSRAETFLAAMAGGVLLVLAMVALQGAFPTDHDAAAPIVATTPTQDGLIRLASLNLREECFAHQAGQELSITHCCTQCHSAAGKLVSPPKSIAVIAASCRACHP